MGPGGPREEDETGVTSIWAPGRFKSSVFSTPGRAFCYNLFTDGDSRCRQGKSFVQGPTARNVQQGILGMGKPGWKQKTQGHGKREAWIT